MEIREPQESERGIFNQLVTHPLQSWEWGEFRKKTGVIVIRRIFLDNGNPVSAFQLTIHKIPKSPFTIGYLPKGIMPTRLVISELIAIGKEYNTIFIKLEPNIENSDDKRAELKELQLQKSNHPLFTKYTFQLDLTQSEEDLLKNMHPKTRYNIRVAQKHNVEIKQDNSSDAFGRYLQLTWETTKRQKFYAHTEKYHKDMWETLSQNQENKDALASYLFTATYKDTILTTWILFRFNNVLYYPYGASTNEFREVMANNLMMWEVIKFGKEIGCTVFDMWGSLGPDANSSDPWHGFHRFKQGYNPRLVEFLGSWDLVTNPVLYPLYNISHTLRWLYLRIKK